MIILKFGGTSVGSPSSIREVIKISLNSKKNYKIAVVVSAFGGVTDQLIGASQKASDGDQSYKKELNKIVSRHLKSIHELIQQKNRKTVLGKIKNTLKELENLLNGIFLIQECSAKTLDIILSFGERLSAEIIAEAFQKYTKTEFLDARDLVKTDSNFGTAKVDFEKTDKNISEYFNKHKALQVITGFIGSNNGNQTTTLGRGGSDYTAAIFGSALNAKEIQIWTDVDGIMTADPRKVKKAFPLKGLSYIEAMEMSHFGAKVIHPPTMKPAMLKSIPIRIKNTMNPDFPGSVISHKTTTINSPIKGISSIKDIALLQLQGSGMVGIPGVSSRLFGALARQKINIILISQASSEHSICFAISSGSALPAQKAIEEEFALEIRNKEIDPVSIEKDLCIIAAVGSNMKKSPGMSGTLFTSLGKNGVNVVAIAQGSSELNISIVIPNGDESKAITAIHDAFFLSETKSLNIFLLGVGLIGGTLLKQIQLNSQRIKENQSLEIKVVALGNSKKMLFDENGIDLKNWKNLLEKSEMKSNIGNFVEKMKAQNLSNSVFVDCTSSENVIVEYENILKSSISIVTPNKKANSSNIEDYLKLNLATTKSKAKFFYETNVGAGLPIISTLKDLLYSGDKVIKIEAVLSGTLSYIFNSFTGKKSFSEVVKEAQVKGYTEPDPRDDLNGLDVARKLLILARETGQALEMKDIKTENLVPENCRKTKSIEDFFKELKKSDKYFTDKKNLAEKKGEKLCYIATLEGNKASIELKSIADSHPFYSLSGSDNIISYTTTRYFDRPLVIRGPGAGSEVTAAGIFADLLRVSETSYSTHIAKNSFDEKLKDKNLVLSLIGMSNIGKTYWSSRLRKLGFKHINCDDLIEAKLAPVLKTLGYKGIKDVAKWLGQPYEKQFAKNQQKYSELETEAIKEITKLIKNPKENIVIDTTGSVIYTNPNNLAELKRHSFVVFIESTATMEKEMYDNFLSHPKPLIWGDVYNPQSEESQSETLSRCYINLLDQRNASYKNLANITIPYYQLSDYKLSAKQFLDLIREKL